MKKGFTLIELLAVIVILAIIALIATPIVLNIINDAKESTLLRSANFYIDSVEYSIAKRVLNGKSIGDGTYNIMQDGNICLETLVDNTCTGDILKVEVDGEKPKGDKITIKDGQIVSHVIKFGDSSFANDSEIDINDNVDVELTTLTEKTWNGLTSFNGDNVWTDGTNIYYSSYDEQYVLNGDTWETKTWNGLTNFYGSDVWTDGTNTYYSSYDEQYVLNGDTWETKTWNGSTSFSGSYIWTDGTNTYWSYKTAQYVLNGNAWIQKTWDGLTVNELTYFDAADIWTDGNYVYFSNQSYHQYVLNGNKWEKKTWNGSSEFYGNRIWTDGTNYYYSSGSNQYIFS